VHLNLLPPPLVVTQFGEGEGHPFHGNQYTGGYGGSAEVTEAGRAGNAALTEQFVSPGSGSESDTNAYLTDQLLDRAAADPTNHLHEEVAAYGKEFAQSGADPYAYFTHAFLHAWGWGYFNEPELRVALLWGATRELHAAPDEFQKTDSLTSDRSEVVNGALDLTDNYGDAIAALVAAQYEVTQEELRLAGITEVTVFRGFDPEEGTFHSGENVDVNARALSSWSTNVEQATEFGSTVLRMTVPASQVFSTGATGFGSFLEQEVVVINREHDTARVIKGDEYDWPPSVLDQKTGVVVGPINGDWAWA